jgi:hypothetical protein
MRRFLRTLTLLSLPWFVVGAIWIVSSKQKPDTGQDKEPAKKIEPGVMSEKQKEHSKLYDGYYPKGQGRLDEDPLNQRVRDFQANMYSPPGLGPAQAAIPIEQFMQRKSCTADAVVAGEVMDNAPQLVASGQFLFTEYTVRITDVYKKNPLTEVLPGSEITVVRPGGKAEIHGRTVKTIDGRFLPLTVGSRVLLFLKYVPKTGSYDSALDRGSFEFHNDILVPLTDEVVSGFNGKDGVQFGSNITSAIATGCSR